VYADGWAGDVTTQPPALDLADLLMLVVGLMCSFDGRVFISLLPSCQPGPCGGLFFAWSDNALLDGPGLPLCAKNPDLTNNMPTV
jgi:hypothetical protein